MTQELGDILVVDDEASVVEVVKLYLQREGFSVRIARDGQAALTAVRQKPPTLIVLDLMLPHIDGMEILRRLRENPATDVPVIMLTARSQETDRIYGLEMGADDYVTKPFSPAELVSRVKAVLRRAGGGGPRACRRARPHCSRVWNDSPGRTHGTRSETGGSRVSRRRDLRPRGRDRPASAVPAGRPRSCGRGR